MAAEIVVAVVGWLVILATLGLVAGITHDWLMERLGPDIGTFVTICLIVVEIAAGVVAISGVDAAFSHEDHDTAHECGHHARHHGRR